MVNQRSLQALITTWHELPLLVGPAWSDVFERVRRKLLEILASQDSAERDWLVSEVLEIFRPHTAAASRLAKVRSIFGMDAGTRIKGPLRPTALPGWPELVDGTAHRLDPPAETRFTDITAPERLPLGQRGVITLRLTPAAEPGSVRAEELVVRLDQKLEVHLVALSRRLGILGKSVKELTVDPHVESEPVVFYVFGQQLGEAQIRLVLHQNGQVVGSVPLKVEISDAATREELLTAAPAVAVEIGGPYVPPADLDFQVLLRHSAGQASFCFVLTSHTGAVDAFYRTYEGKAILGSPEAWRSELLSSLERFRTARQLDSIGERLFEDLIPEELGVLLRELLTSPVRTLKITSEEPWIPWELLKPDTGPGAPEPFWCERFQITRWPSCEVRPSSRIDVGRLACVDASARSSEQSQRSAGEDRCYLSQLARRSSIDDASPEEGTFERLGALLDQGDVDLWHFAAPGSADGGEEMPAIRLADGELTALELDRRRRRKIAERRPLVVLNVSGAGRQRSSLTGLAGWASVWVERSRCGAFIAPLWTVRSDLAHSWSRAFYEALERGEALGEAVSSARRAVREENMGDPTWLAYSVYGHPNARIVLGAATETTP